MMMTNVLRMQFVSHDGNKINRIDVHSTANSEHNALKYKNYIERKQRKGKFIFKKKKKKTSVRKKSLKTRNIEKYWNSIFDI